MTENIAFLPTADVADALGAAVRSCDTQFRDVGGRRGFCGRITTVRCREDNALVKEILNEDNPGGVLVIDGGGSLHTSLIGDMVATAGRDHGWAGVIAYGACRDTAVIGQLDFGLKALGTNPRKSGKTGAGERDVPVGFGGVVFHPGEVLYADGDGVVVTDRPVTAGD